MLANDCGPGDFVGAAKHGSELGVGESSLFPEPAHFADLGFRQLEHLGLISSPVVGVGKARIPAKIFQPVVRGYAVVMAGFGAVRRLANKGKQDEAVDLVKVLPSIWFALQSNAQMPRVGGALAVQPRFEKQGATVTSCDSPLQSPNAAQRGNFMQPLPAGNGGPYFSHQPVCSGWSRVRQLLLRGLTPMLLLTPPQGLAQQNTPIANNISTTNAGQASGTVLNSNTQLNQLPVLTQEYGAGFRCQNSTVSLSPYYVGSAASYGFGGSANGFGGMVTVSAPLDGRGVELCMAMAKARVAKEQFDLAIVRTLKCADLLRAGIVFTSKEMQDMCQGIAYNPRQDATKGAVIPETRQGPPQVILTK